MIEVRIPKDHSLGRSGYGLFALLLGAGSVRFIVSFKWFPFPLEFKLCSWWWIEGVKWRAAFFVIVPGDIRLRETLQSDICAMKYISNRETILSRYNYRVILDSKGSSCNE